MTTHLVTVTFDPTGATANLAAQADTEGARPTRIVGTAFAVGTPSGPSSDGHRYQFAGLPANVDELIDVVDQHTDAAVVGRLAEPFQLDEQGALAAGNARIFDTTAGRDVLVLAAEGVRGGFSVSAAFDSFTEDAEGVRHVETWRARHLGVVRHPAFTESQGLTLAASAATNPEEGTPMPPTNTDTPPAGVQAVELPTVAELAAQVSEILREQGSQETHPLARFNSAPAFFAAFLGADEDEREQLAAAFAVPVQLPADSPGVMRPGWREAMVANLDRRRPGITAFGGPSGLPDGGTSVEWPYFNGDLDAIVAEQAAAGDELTGVLIKILKGTASLRTAGVASSIPYQMLMRSTPSYLAQHQAICEAAWGRFTEAVFEGAISLAGTEAVGALVAIAAGAKPSAYSAQLFDASGAVEDATGAPAEFALVSPGVWSELGGADLPNPENSNGGGTPNATGTASASRLRVNVNGLEHYRAPFLTGDQVIVSNTLAARYSEQGPMVATADAVTKLSQDVATWGMYVPAEVYFPAGIVRLDRAA